jgi:hypothetical protein
VCPRWRRFGPGTSPSGAVCSHPSSRS